MKKISFLILTLITLYGCQNNYKAQICNSLLSNGDTLPLQYDKVNKNFLQDLYKATEKFNQSGAVSGTMSDLMNGGFILYSLGFGSDGEKIYVRDIDEIIKSQENGSWGRYMQMTGLCDLM